MYIQRLLQVQYNERVPSQETRGEGTRRSNDADCDVRRRAPSFAGRDAGERGPCWSGFGFRVNVRK